MALEIESDDSALFQDLIASILAVNRISLEKGFEVTRGLESAGLMQPELLARVPKSELSEVLINSGYRRSAFMAELMATRIVGCATWVVANGLKDLRRLEASGKREELRAVLLQIDGVGPAVVESFLRLRHG